MLYTWRVCPQYPYRGPQQVSVTVRLTRASSKSPPTLKCRRIHSLSLFFQSQNRHKRPIKKPKLHQKRLAAGLRPDPLGELECSPRPLSRNMGPISKGRGRGEEEGEGREKKGSPHFFVHVYAPGCVNAVSTQHNDDIARESVTKYILILWSPALAYIAIESEETVNNNLRVFLVSFFLSLHFVRHRKTDIHETFPQFVICIFSTCTFYL